MKRLFFSLSVVLIIISTYADQILYRAVCKVPVADMVHEPICSYGVYDDVQKAYENLPLAWARTDADRPSCPRVDQLLFQEVVDVIDQKGDEVLVVVPYKKPGIFWTLKSNLVPLEQVNIKNTIDLLLPPSISYQENNITFANENVITLKHPYYCQELKMLLSVGTRFLLYQEEEHEYRVTTLNPCICFAQNISIPQQVAVKGYDPDPLKRQALFVEIVREWTRSPGIIPYVWGGSSYQTKIEDEAFQEISIKTIAGNFVAFWHRKNVDTNPINGFDCSGLIARAAHIASLPLYFKNTTTLECELREIENNEPIENGDIIWFKGHVVIISDVEKNLAIEARGYSSGWGQLHEIELPYLFENITTYADLRKAIITNAQIILLTKDGKPGPKPARVKILKMRSCYEKKSAQA